MVHRAAVASMAWMLLLAGAAAALDCHADFWPEMHASPRRLEALILANGALVKLCFDADADGLYALLGHGGPADEASERGRARWRQLSRERQASAVVDAFRTRGLSDLSVSRGRTLSSAPQWLRSRGTSLARRRSFFSCASWLRWLRCMPPPPRLPPGVAQAGMQRDRTALGEAGQHDTIGRDAALAATGFETLAEDEDVDYEGARRMRDHERKAETSADDGASQTPRWFRGCANWWSCSRPRVHRDKCAWRRRPP